MRYELKSISVWSVVKVAFVFNCVGGLLYGLFSALFMGTMLSMMSGSGLIPMDEFSDGDFSVGALIIIMPLVFAAGAVFFGTLCAVMMAVLYNLTSGILGGLEFEFQQTDQPEASFAAPEAAPVPVSSYQPPPPPPPPVSDPAPAPPPPPEIDPSSGDKSDPPSTV